MTREPSLDENLLATVFGSKEPIAAFVQTLTELPTEFEILHRADGAYEIVVLLACHSTDGRIVALVVRLAPTSIEGVNVYEFSFSIAVNSVDGSHEPFETQDRNVAIPYLPGSLRGLLMWAVCGAAKELVEQVSPRYIYRVAKGVGLPEKAMSKHHLVTSALEDCGYTVVDSGTEHFGRSFWLMETLNA